MTPQMMMSLAQQYGGSWDGPEEGFNIPEAGRQGFDQAWANSWEPGTAEGNTNLMQQYNTSRLPGAGISFDQYAAGRGKDWGFGGDQGNMWMLPLLIAAGGAGLGGLGGAGAGAGDFASLFGDFAGVGAEAGLSGFTPEALVSRAASLGSGLGDLATNEALTSTLGSGWGAAVPTAGGSLWETIKSAGSLPWKSIANIGNIGSGVYGLLQGRRMQNQNSLGDDELRALMADPSRIYGLPGWQAGLQAIQRAGAAQGWTGSGNMMAALQKYGGDFYNQEFQRLAGLRSGNVQGQSAGLSLQGNSINRILAGLAGMEGQSQSKTALDSILEQILGRRG